MVKEFQLLKKHVTQLLVKQQQEIALLKKKQLEQQQEIFIDVVKLIEELSEKGEIANRALDQNNLIQPSPQETYNNIKNDLIQLLYKYDVQPITENVGSNQLDQTKDSIIGYTYQGKVLKR